MRELPLTSDNMAGQALLVRDPREPKRSTSNAHLTKATHFSYRDESNNQCFAGTGVKPKPAVLQTTSAA